MALQLDLPSDGSPALDPPSEGWPALNPPRDGWPALNPPSDGWPALEPPNDGSEKWLRGGKKQMSTKCCLSQNGDKAY